MTDINQELDMTTKPLTEDIERAAFMQYLLTTPDFAPEFVVHRAWAEQFAWFAWQARAALALPQAAPVAVPEPEIPLGFKVAHVPNWSALTDEANAAFRWSVERIDAPYCGKDGVRIWNGRTMREAIGNACAALGMSPTPPAPGVPTLLPSDQQIANSTSHLYYAGKPVMSEYRIAVVRAALASTQPVGEVGTLPAGSEEFLGLLG